MDMIGEENRVYAVENGRTVAEVTFFDRDDGAVEINHTYVDDSLRGQGVAGRLIAAAADVIEKSGKKVVPSCSYAISWFAKHPERKNLLQ